MFYQCHDCRHDIVSEDKYYEIQYRWGHPKKDKEILLMVLCGSCFTARMKKEKERNEEQK